MFWSNRRATAVGAGAVGVAAFVYAAAIEPYRLQHVEIEIMCARLPAAFDGYRLLQISDLHMRKLGRREKTLAKMLQALPPHDLALLTGDMIHTTSGTPHLIELCKSINAIEGIYAIFGNSEHKNGVQSNVLTQELRNVGIKALNNEHVFLTRGADQICLMGVDDPVSQKEDLRAAIKGVADEDFKVLLMHSPDPIGQAAAYGIDLVISGHTHGGQIRLPGIGPLHTNSVLGLGMDSGLFSGAKLFPFIGFRAGRTQLYVTRGVGSSGLSLRFNCLPEFTTITLRRP